MSSSSLLFRSGSLIHWDTTIESSRGTTTTTTITITTTKTVATIIATIIATTLAVTITTTRAIKETQETQSQEKFVAFNIK